MRKKTIDWAQVPNGECVILNPNFPRIVTRYNSYATDVKTREVFSVQATEQCIPVLSVLEDDLNLPEVFKDLAFMLTQMANLSSLKVTDTAGKPILSSIRQSAQTIVDRCNDALPKITRGDL